MDLNKKIEDISQAEYKLLLIVGQPGSGKSKIIRQYSEETGIPILDLDKIFYHTPTGCKLQNPVRMWYNKIRAVSAAKIA